MPAPVASGLLPPVLGLAQSLQPGSADEETLAGARAALDRLVSHLENAAATGSPDASLGSEKLRQLLGDPEAMAVDLGRLEEVADGERTRLKGRLVQDCHRLRPGVEPGEVIKDLLADHPDDDGIHAAARLLLDELSQFTLEHGLLPELGGTCLVGAAPPSRSYAVAMMSWTATL